MADRDESRRAVARRQVRKAGDRSADLARTLMELKDARLARLQLDEDLRDAVNRARAITAPIARRRAERTLAGELRHFDLVEVATQLETADQGGADATKNFHLAEKWRARLIEEGLSAAAEFPGGPVDPLPLLIQNARRERDTGKPPGAARALFRHVMATLTNQAARAAADED